MENLTLGTIIFGNSVQRYLTALAVLFIMAVIILIVTKTVGSIFNKLSEKTENKVAHLIFRADERLSPILYFLPFYYVTYHLNTPFKVRSIVAGIGLIIAAVCIILYALDIIKVFLSEYSKRHGVNPFVLNSLNIVATGVLWGFGILFVLSNLGFNISTLIAGLGIGGIAVALASQTLLGDLFNYFSILLDQPFQIGDIVQVGENTGTIQSIGLKGTRLVSSTGEQIIISNTDMTKSVLRNYQVMEKRRSLAKLGITYNTPADKIKMLPDLLRDIINSVPDIEFARAHFSEFGDSSLNYEVVYFVLSNNYTTFMDRVQQVNFKIVDEFARLGIDFAFPSQSVYVENSLRIKNEQ